MAGLLRKIDDHLFKGEPFSCESLYSLEDSIELLGRKVTQIKTLKDHLTTIASTKPAIGKISASKVILKLMYSPKNSKGIDKKGSPATFVGHFEQENGKTYLKGNFTTNIFVKFLIYLFIIFFFVFAVLIAFSGVPERLAYLAQIPVSERISYISIRLIPTVAVSLLVLWLAVPPIIKSSVPHLEGDVEYLKDLMIRALRTRGENPAKEASDETKIGNIKNTPIGKHTKRI
jgi:hypothetical protein